MLENIMANPFSVLFIWTQWRPLSLPVSSGRGTYYVISYASEWYNFKLEKPSRENLIPFTVGTWTWRTYYNWIISSTASSLQGRTWTCLKRNVTFNLYSIHQRYQSFNRRLRILLLKFQWKAQFISTRRLLIASRKLIHHEEGRDGIFSSPSTWTHNTVGFGWPPQPIHILRTARRITSHRVVNMVSPPLNLQLRR